MGQKRPKSACPTRSRSIQVRNQNTQLGLVEEIIPLPVTSSSISDSHGANGCEAVRNWLAQCPVNLTEREQAAVLALVSGVSARIGAANASQHFYSLCHQCDAKGFSTLPPGSCSRCGSAKYLTVEAIPRNHCAR